MAELGRSPANEWFEYIKSMKLRTYFNDHPFPVANQTSPKEIAFRYNGLSEWIGRGLTYWWFGKLSTTSFALYISSTLPDIADQ